MVLDYSFEADVNTHMKLFSEITAEVSHIIMNRKLNPGLTIYIFFLGSSRGTTIYTMNETDITQSLSSTW